MPEPAINRASGLPLTAPHPTFLPSPLSSGKTQRSGGRWGAAAQAQSRSPRRVSGKSRLRSLGPGPPRQPLSPRGTRLPWPLRAAVFSGSWDSSCCPHPQPPLVPASEPLTRPLPSSGRSAAAAGASPVRTLRPLARPASAAVRRPLLCLPRGSGECPAAFSPSRAFSFISAAPDSLGTLSFPTAPSFQPCLSVPQPLSSAF